MARNSSNFSLMSTPAAAETRTLTTTKKVLMSISVLMGGGGWERGRVEASERQKQNECLEALWLALIPSKDSVSLYVALYTTSVTAWSGRTFAVIRCSYLTVLPCPLAMPFLQAGSSIR